MKRLLLSLGVLALSLPLGVLLALLLVPLWRWLEDFGSVEAIGHSGPAAWCYGICIGLFALLGLLMLWRRP
ncbi:MULTISPECIES: hypothetical protein [unclassified Pseudomonas]|uniref:hypothetical protein n=1 Tax=unclassified Pseudomonas TaxID=196821 RepID=UPI0024482E78|nr:MULTISPECIES: hypothetical protein [unclassified Pseudomonas]MDG9922671.1 hypothetical protein [Pseudomonas sp. GD04045]MDH0033196.1 hypothetical protein [Pseudomonas sp. GD04019]